MRITIGGCRDFTDYDYFTRCVQNYLKEINNSEEIVILSGHCSGVDKMAEKFAKENGFLLEIHPAEWKKYGRGAGPKRNKEMVEKSDTVIAFWNGISKGTKTLIDLSKKNHVQTIVYNI